MSVTKLVAFKLDTWPRTRDQFNVLSSTEPLRCSCSIRGHTKFGDNWTKGLDTPCSDVEAANTMAAISFDQAKFSKQILQER